VFFLVWGLLFGLAAVILTFLWRIAALIPATLEVPAKPPDE
jgi:hypothetical protein